MYCLLSLVLVIPSIPETISRHHTISPVLNTLEPLIAPILTTLLRHVTCDCTVQESNIK